MDKRLQAYYTKEQVITNYMVKMLDLRNGNTVLEPCVGDGAFIESLLSSGKNLSIEAVDINEEEINNLKTKYRNSNIVFRTTDTLLDNSFDLMSGMNSGFDRIIGNPPYGGWQDIERRNHLKIKYGKETNVKETYTLFFERCLSLLNIGGKLTFIIPDTFLYIHSHKGLRRKILDTCEVESILLFPSKLFPGVKFGYSKLCIITLSKVEHPAIEHEIKVFKNINSLEDIKRVGIGDLKYNAYRQIQFKKNDSYSFIFDENDEYEILLNRNESKQLGEIAAVATGLYTGNNSDFIFKKSNEVPRSKNYKLISDLDKINKEVPKLTGVEGSKHYIPIVKGSFEEPYVMMPDNWLVDWSTESVEHYNNDKKARFQNKQYYFKKGLALPMVKSKKIKATVMIGRVFDQSIVGIFPKNETNLYYLLALFNSDVGTKLIHLINPSVNNSANYLKKIPILFGSKYDFERISKLAQKLSINTEGNLFNTEEHKKINEYFEMLYGSGLKDISTDNPS